MFTLMATLENMNSCDAKGKSFMELIPQIMKLFCRIGSVVNQFENLELIDYALISK